MPRARNQKILWSLVAVSALYLCSVIFWFSLSAGVDQESRCVEHVSHKAKNVTFHYELPALGQVCPQPKSRPGLEPSRSNCKPPCNTSAECLITEMPRVDFYSLLDTRDLSCIPPLEPLHEIDEALQLIHEHQFPESCDDIHQTGWALAMAMEHDRILMLHPASQWIYADEAACSAAGFPLKQTETAHCFFKQLTKCQLPQGWKQHVYKTSAAGVIDPEAKVVSFKYLVGETRPNYESTVPKQIRERFFPGLTPEISDEWTCNRYLVHEEGPLTFWRAAANRFLLRPNDALTNRLEQIDRMMSLMWEVDFSDPTFCAIAMHVRHGDKFVESKLHDFAEYVDAARSLRKRHKWLNKCSYVLLSTEDPNVIAEAEKSPRKDAEGFEWRFIYTPTPRFNETLSPMQLADIIGKSRMFYYDFFNFWITKRASAFVLTLSSNWSRMINYMRLADGRRNMPIVDLEYGACLERYHMQPKLSSSPSRRQNSASVPFFYFYVSMFVRPRRTFDMLMQHHERLLFGSIALLLSASLYTAFYFMAAAAGGAPSTFKPWLVIPIEDYFSWDRFIVAPSMIAGWLLAAAVAQLLSKCFGGRGSFEDSLAAYGFAISIANWSTLVHDLTDAVLGAAGFLDMRWYEEQLNTPTIWRSILWTCFAVYFVAHPMLFTKGIGAAQKLSGPPALFVGTLSFIIYQFVFLIFNR